MFPKIMKIALAGLLKEVLRIVNNVETSILESLVVPTRVGREYMEMNKVNCAMKA